MPKFLIQKHLNFFSENGFIEFENVFSEKEFLSLQNELFSLVKDREEKNLSGSQLGRNFWKDSPVLQNLFTTSVLPSITASLFKESFFRLAFDQFYDFSFANSFPALTSLDQISPIQKILCGVFLCLNPFEKKKETDFFPNQTGHLLFLKDTTLFPLKVLLENKKNLLLVAYAKEDAFYKNSTEFPSHQRGKLLAELSHPIIQKSSLF